MLPNGGRLYGAVGAVNGERNESQAMGEPVRSNRNVKSFDFNLICSSSNRQMRFQCKTMTVEAE